MLRAEGLKGAIIYYDGQMNDTRMGLTVALTATQHGAVVANRVKVNWLVRVRVSPLPPPPTHTLFFFLEKYVHA